MKPDAQAVLDEVLTDNLTPRNLYDLGLIDGHELLSKTSLEKITSAVGHAHMVTRSVLNNQARASILPMLFDTVISLRAAALCLRYIEPADEVRARALYNAGVPLVQRTAKLRKKMDRLWEYRERIPIPKLRTACYSIARQLQALADELGDEAASWLGQSGYCAAMDSRGQLGSQGEL